MPKDMSDVRKLLHSEVAQVTAPTRLGVPGQCMPVPVEWLLIFHRGRMNGLPAEPRHVLPAFA